MLLAGYSTIMDASTILPTEGISPTAGMAQPTFVSSPMKIITSVDDDNNGIIQPLRFPPKLKTSTPQKSSKSSKRKEADTSVGDVSVLSGTNNNDESNETTMEFIPLVLKSPSAGGVVNGRESRSLLTLSVHKSHGTIYPVGSHALAATPHGDERGNSSQQQIPSSSLVEALQGMRDQGGLLNSRDIRLMQEGDWSEVIQPLGDVDYNESDHTTGAGPGIETERVTGRGRRSPRGRDSNVVHPAVGRSGVGGLDVGEVVGGQSQDVDDEAEESSSSVGVLSAAVAAEEGSSLGRMQPYRPPGYRRQGSSSLPTPRQQHHRSSSETFVVMQGKGGVVGGVEQEGVLGVVPRGVRGTVGGRGSGGVGTEGTKLIPIGLSSVVPAAYGVDGGMEGDEAGGQRGPPGVGLVSVRPRRSSGGGIGGVGGAGQAYRSSSLGGVGTDKGLPYDMMLQLPKKSPRGRLVSGKTSPRQLEGESGSKGAGAALGGNMLAVRRGGLQLVAPQKGTN